ncbi:transmembrane protein [Cyclospora cayetanensis]|uniref:Transmembrane protein n=1 Tax=Cyclospora cayetanensis TaxID=88456 RepID=A0A1D3CR09_9EIME|nr:transmembrane protein [Cyclospora cayetanensis]
MQGLSAAAQPPLVVSLSFLVCAFLISIPSSHGVVRQRPVIIPAQWGVQTPPAASQWVHRIATLEQRGGRRLALAFLDVRGQTRRPSRRKFRRCNFATAAAAESPAAAVPAGESPSAPAARTGLVSFSPGLPDSVLPPQTMSPPQVDPQLMAPHSVPSVGTAPCAAPEASAASCAAAGERWEALSRDADGALQRVVGSSGPLSLFDSGTELHPTLRGGSDDFYYINFHGALQLSAVEVAATALAAAKRFVGAQELRRKRGSWLAPEGDARTAGAHAAQDCSHAARRRGILRGGALEAEAADTRHSMIVEAVNVSRLLRQSRFASPPYWLRERVAFLLRRGSPPTSFGFIVGSLLQCLVAVGAAEEQLGVTLDAFAARRLKKYQESVAEMNAAQQALLLTDGSPGNLRDTLKFRRGFPLFPWGLPADSQSTLAFIKEKLKTDERSLTQVPLAPWRIPLEEVPTHGPTRRLYEGFNSAAIAAIKHVTTSWNRPVSVFSSLESAASLRKILGALGLPKEALERVHVVGVDGILLGTDPVGHRPRKIGNDHHGEALADLPPAREDSSVTCGHPLPHEQRADAAGQRGAGELHASSCFSAMTNLEAAGGNGKRRAAIERKLSGALALLQHFRLYFCDWGYSSYEDRLKALILDRIKILPTMSHLVSMLLLPAFLAPRLWAVGSTTAPIEWTEEGRMQRWLRLSGALQQLSGPSGAPNGAFQERPQGT